MEDLQVRVIECLGKQSKFRRQCKETYWIKNGHIPIKWIQPTKVVILPSLIGRIRSLSLSSLLLVFNTRTFVYIVYFFMH